MRQIRYAGRRCIILLQEENGSCPLIALCNILSLRGRIDLDPLVKGRANSGFHIRREDNVLATMLMHRLVDAGAGTTPGDSANRHHTFTDALEHLPKFHRRDSVFAEFRVRLEIQETLCTVQPGGEFSNGEKENERCGSSLYLVLITFCLPGGEFCSVVAVNRS